MNSRPRTKNYKFAATSNKMYDFFHTIDTSIRESIDKNVEDDMFSHVFFVIFEQRLSTEHAVLMGVGDEHILR